MNHITVIIKLCPAKSWGPADFVIYLFIVYLTTLSVSRLLASDERMTESNKLESMWKEAVVA
jgi:hypothetical protein